MNKIRKSIFVCCLLWIFVLTGLVACGGGEGVKVNSANALARKLASDSAIKINLSKDIFLEEPVIVNGEKEIVGNGKIIATVEGGEENYMLTVANGGKLTVGGSVKIDASGLLGGIHVQENGTAVIAEKAVVMNASEITANALVEGSFHVQGGTLKEANGHNIYNKNETVISGGEIVGSGDKYAGVYNEGTLSQTGGSVTNAYNNISNMSGSVFTFEGGTNTKSIRDGIFIAEGASLKATKKDAVIEEAGARGILLHGKADIKAITVKSCSDTLIKVGKRGVLNLGNGILQEGNYHGVDNAGTMTMMGGNIQMNKNCGIVNTGTLKVSGGNIANNENKGILNKHKGKADVTSAMVNFTSNKIAIANEDKAEFEFAKAKILMSTQTNVYCYDGTINLHDISLNASTSNNVRVIDGVVNMTNVEVKGNSQKSNASHHGIMLEGGEVIAENVTVSMTTGCGMRVKGGAFKGENIKMHDINRTAISMSKHDYLDMEGLVDIKGLEIESTNYNNVLNEGGGTIKITNGKLAVATSNSVRADDGRIELTNVTVPGHTKESVNYVYGIYMEGGDIVAKNVTVQNTTGGALRVKHGKFAGNNIKILNAKGDSAISNLPLNDDVKDGIIEIDGLTMKNSFSKNITLDSGVTIIKNAKLGPTGGNNIKMNNNAATLKLYNVNIEGQRDDAAKSTHGIMVEGGNVFGEKVQITNALTCGIRCKLGVVDLKDVTMTKLGAEGISCSKMVKDKVELGVGKVKIDGLTIKQAGTKNIDLDAGTVHIINADLEKIATNNHNVKVGGTGLIIMENTKIHGTSNNTKYSIIAEGGDVELNNVEICDSAKSAIHINKDSSSVKGTNIVIQKAVEGITGYKGVVELKDVKLSEITTNGMNVSGGKFTINGLETKAIGEKNVIADGDVKVTVLNGDLCATEKHNVQSRGKESSLTLQNVTIKGVTSDWQYGVIAEKGGDVTLKGVTIEDVKANAIHINTEDSKITGSDVTISNVRYGIYASKGIVDLKTVSISDAASAVNATGGNLGIKGLKTENITNNNIFAGDDNAEKSEEQCVITVTNGDLCKTISGHNVKSTMNGNIVLKNVHVKGTEANDKYGVIVEKGSSVDLTDVTIQDVPARAGIHSNHADSVITGANVTIINAPTAVQMRCGKLDIDGLTTEDIKDKNILVEEVLDSSDKTDVTVKNATLCKTSSHNVHIKDEDGSVTLKNVTILGTSGNHGVMAEGGDVVLKDVTISNIARVGICINKDTSSVTGENITITNAEDGVTGTKGKVEIKGLTTSGIKVNNLRGETDCIITVKDGNLGQAGGHNVKAMGSSCIELVDTQVKGTSSTGHHAIMAQGGDIDLDNVEISGAKANEGRAALRIDTGSSEINGKDITITDCSVGICASIGNVNIDGLTSSASVKNVEALGSTITIKDATLNATSGYNVEITSGDVTLEDTEVKGDTYGIKSNITFKLAGEVKSNILLEEPVSVEATKALTGSEFTIDWAIGKLPTDFVAIQFKDADAMEATKSNSTITFGSYASELYKPQYSGTQLMLYVEPIVVSNETELNVAFTTISNRTDKIGLIKLTGDIENTTFTTLPENCKITITDDGNVRTIKRSTNSGNLYKIPATTTLTLLSTSNDNGNPTLIIDGGKEDGKTGTALFENEGTLTVNQGVVLQNNTSANNNQGIAIYSKADSMTTFKGVMRNIVSTYTGDSSPSAVAIYGTVVFENAVVESNTTKRNGLIRLFETGILDAENTTFKNNTSGGHGGIIFNEVGKISFTGCTFTNNKASADGGAIYTKKDSTIRNTKFDGNQASRNGGAIYNASGAKLTLIGDGTDNSVFSNNKSTGKQTDSFNDTTYFGGGAVCIGSGSLTVSGYKFTSNVSDSNGGAINNRGSNVTVNDCKFFSNKAVSPTVNGKTINAYGGAIFMNDGTLNIDKDMSTVTKFEGNEAMYGGAIAQRAGTTTIHNANFTSNKGGWNAGAVYSMRTMNLINCDFTSNTTASKGGAICGEGGTLNVTNCDFTKNVSNDEGGACRLAAGITATITGCTFKENEAKNVGGGAIKFHGNTLTLDGCTFTGNTATKGDANGHDIKLSTTTTKPTIKNSTFNPSKVRDSAGTANAYNDGGENTLVTQ